MNAEQELCFFPIDNTRQETTAGLQEALDDVIRERASDQRARAFLRSRLVVGTQGDPPISREVG